MLIDDGALVLADLIGKKHGNRLFIEGEEFELIDENSDRHDAKL
jgi:hypothetical protein